MKKKTEGTDLKAPAKAEPAAAAARKAGGRKAPAQALKESERPGLHEYEEALRDAALSSEVKRLLRSRLLPKSKASIPAPKRLLKTER
jgi:hypothetical protein